MENQAVMQISSLTRRYGNKTALDALSFECASSGIIGLLGRNGAGKSTMLRILTGQDLPTSGQALIWGQRPFDNANALSRLCLVSDKPQFGNARSLKALLEISAKAYPNWDMGYACDLLERFDLAEYLPGVTDAPTRFKRMKNRKLKSLSRGMQTSLCLTIGLASRAELTFFDEPSLGLDAVMRERFYDILLEERQRSNRCFVVSTHLIEEVARVLDSVVMIEQGRLLGQGTVEALTSTVYCLSGPNPTLPEGAKCLRNEQNGPITLLYCQGARPESVPEGITLSSINLQRLFVLLTDPAKGGAA